MDVAFGDDKLDQRDLLFQSVARLERTARKAEESGQFAVVVGCVAQLNKMMPWALTRRAFAVTQPTTSGVDLAIFEACSTPYGLQGFLPHLSGDVGGHQHGAEFALSKKALSTQISFERPSM